MAVSGPVSHQLDIYDVGLHLATAPEQIDTIRERVGCGDDALSLDNAAGIFGAVTTVWDTQARQTHVVIFINVKHKRHRDKHELVNTVAHEASHAAANILDDIGVADGEAEAYLVGWIAGWIHKNLR